MELIKLSWAFFQNELLGMRWLHRLIGNLLTAFGLDTSGRLGGSVQFFLYDTMKIIVLLGCLILMISYIQSFFPPERTRKILGRFHGIRANAIAAQYAWEQVRATARKVFPYVLLGVGIGAWIHNWIPEAFILGSGNPFGVIIATIAGVPMYADIFGTIPIAEALLAKGAQLGVVLSFMMGVTTLSLPSMIMLKKAIKTKLLAVFAAICTVGIILIGYFFNAIQFLLI